MVAYDFNVAKAVKRADVLVGAVLIPGARAPHVVTREMVRTMKPRSVIMDISIDQGGCVETSRPTTYQNPTYIEEGVIHYCVPNMTGVVARTTTHAVQQRGLALHPEIAQKGLEQALAADPALRHGLNIHNGEIVHPALRESLAEVSRMNWRRRLPTTASSAPPTQAVQAIKSHDRVFMTGNCSVPKELLGALVRRAPQLEDVEIVQVLTIGPAEYVAPEMQGHIRVNSLFISHNVRKAVNEGRADFTPIFLSQIPRALRDPEPAASRTWP